MSAPLRVIPAMLLITLALAGGAAASPCPNCNPGSGDNWWSTIDVGAVGNATGPVKHDLDSGALENTGIGLSHSDDEKGFWAYLAVCFEAWANKLSKLTGVDLHVKGKTNVYVDQKGVDIDADVAGHSFDQLPVVGKADDLTWQANAQARSTLAAHGVDVPTVQGLPTEKLPTVHGDICVDAKVTLPCL